MSTLDDLVRSNHEVSRAVKEFGSDLALVRGEVIRQGGDIRTLRADIDRMRGSDPPDYTGLSVSGSGEHVLIKARGKTTPVESWLVQAIVEQIAARSDERLGRLVRGAGFWTAKNAAKAAIGVLIISILAHLGIAVAAHF